MKTKLSQQKTRLNDAKSALVLPAATALDVASSLEAKTDAIMAQYVSFGDIEHLFSRKDIKLVERANLYVTNMLHSLEQPNASLYVSTPALRDAYGMNNPGKNIRFNLVLDDFASTHENRKRFVEARQNHFILNGSSSEYIKPEGSFFEKQSVRFRTDWNGDSYNDLFKVRQYIEPRSLVAQARAIFSPLAYEDIKLVWQNQKSFEKDYTVREL